MLVAAPGPCRRRDPVDVARDTCQVQGPPRGLGLVSSGGPQLASKLAPAARKEELHVGLSSRQAAMGFLQVQKRTARRSQRLRTRGRGRRSKEIRMSPIVEDPD